MLSKLILPLVLTSFFVGCDFSDALPSDEVAQRVVRIKINSFTGDKSSVPLGNGLTIVNLFDEFSTGCPTGNRFETMERLNSLRPPGTSLLLIFSDKHFSTQDVENFKAILSMPESMLQGDIEAIRPHLSYGKLLVVLDSKGRVIWHEKADMSEPQVFSEVSQLIHATSN